MVRNERTCTRPVQKKRDVKLKHVKEKEKDRKGRTEQNGVRIPDGPIELKHITEKEKDWE